MIPLAHFRYKVSPVDALILVYHVTHCEDAENDADRTIEELINHLDTFGYIGKGVLESALYCCNMENERRKFWHPQKRTFDSFLDRMLPNDQKFNKEYNFIFRPDKD